MEQLSKPLLEYIVRAGRHPYSEVIVQPSFLPDGPVGRK